MMAGCISADVSGLANRPVSSSVTPWYSLCWQGIQDLGTRVLRRPWAPDPHSLSSGAPLY